MCVERESKMQRAERGLGGAPGGGTALIHCLVVMCAQGGSMMQRGERGLGGALGGAAALDCWFVAGLIGGSVFGWRWWYAF